MHNNNKCRISKLAIFSCKKSMWGFCVHDVSRQNVKWREIKFFNFITQMKLYVFQI